MSKIDQLDGGAISNASRDAVGGVAPAKPVGSGAAGTGSAQTAASESSDSVSITDSGRALAALSEAVQSAPEVDPARVATLRQALESGSYSIDDDAIAGRMLQVEHDLNGSGQ